MQTNYNVTRELLGMHAMLAFLSLKMCGLKYAYTTLYYPEHTPCNIPLLYTYYTFQLAYFKHAQQ